MYIIKKVSSINNVDIPEYLYKYMTFEQFIDLVEMERLYLTRITLWEDTYEGYTIKEYQKDRFNKFGLPDTTMYLDVELEIKSIYAQSWTYLINESDALWRIYSPQKTGVRIKVKTKNITDYIACMMADSGDMYRELLNGKVEYGKKVDYEKFKYGNRTSGSPFVFMKRKAFEHEKEYRFAFRIMQSEVVQAIGDIKVIDDYRKKIENYNPTNVVYYKIPNKFIEEIILDPRASSYFEETFIKYCEKRELNNNGTLFKKSDLYKIP